MKFLAIMPMFLTLLVGCTAYADKDVAAISDKMASLAGPAAIECGSLKSGASLQEAWECAGTADRNSRAFWLAVEGYGTDATIWHVIARSATGERYVVFYTGQRAGQPSFAPSFTVTSCSEPFQLFRNKRFRLRCGPDVP